MFLRNTEIKAKFCPITNTYSTGNLSVSINKKNSAVCYYRPLTKALEYIEEMYEEEIKLEDIAEAAGISKFTLCRVFQNKFNTSPMKFLWLFRACLAAKYLKSTLGIKLTDIAFACGFTSSAHFSRVFKETFNKTPSQYKKNQQKSSGLNEINNVRYMSDHANPFASQIINQLSFLNADFSHVKQI